MDEIIECGGCHKRTPVVGVTLNAHTRKRKEVGHLWLCLACLQVAASLTEGCLKRLLTNAENNL